MIRNIIPSQGSAGQWVSDLVSITVNEPAPVANFTATVTGGTSPLLVQFTDLSSNNPTSWQWSFGDGNTSTTENPAHTYSAPGMYNVTLTATSPVGGNTVTRVGYITVYGANFTANVLSGNAPLNVQFNDTSVGATSWYWDFGDGTNSTLQNPVHQFANAWAYNVTLTITTPGGVCSAEKYNYINVLLPITGNVANPLDISLAQLAGYPQVSISNHTYGAHHEYFQMWATGASLNAILNSSQVNSGASVVTFYGSDGFFATVLLSDIRADNLSMLSSSWYTNDNTSQAGDNQTERDIIPSQTYGTDWVYQLTSIQVI
jgi:PKD repeat protein